MAKNTPVITHTQILCYAMGYLRNEIDILKEKCDSRPDLGADFFEQMTITQRNHLKALKRLYCMETGTEWV